MEVRHFAQKMCRLPPISNSLVEQLCQKISVFFVKITKSHHFPPLLSTFCGKLCGKPVGDIHHPVTYFTYLNTVYMLCTLHIPLQTLHTAFPIAYLYIPFPFIFLLLPPLISSLYLITFWYFLSPPHILFHLIIFSFLLFPLLLPFLFHYILLYFILHSFPFIF